ncbi:MAG: hypothetical protein JSU94_17155 [Phycisphaerales bacterium]|nr:MAG: hypothetical protein JSU94_17155 [Phycisphaerales bacterium]
MVEFSLSDALSASSLAVLGAQAIVALVIYLVLRLATKVKFLTVACLSVLFVTVMPWLLYFFGVSGVLSPSGRRWPARYGVGEYLLLNLLIGALAAVYPIGKLLGAFVKEVSAGSTANSAEKARILQMVEERKVTAEEAAELLDAMGKSSALRGQEKFSRVDLVTLGGVGLVVLGFFLPWVYLNPGRISGVVVPAGSYQAGHHIGAIGWAVLIGGLLSAVPVFVTPKSMLYKISMLQILVTLIGLCLVISILVRAGGHSGAGLVFCVLGFAAGLAASLLKLRALSA